MAIRVAVHRVCDRCLHPFDESTVKYGDALPVFSKRVIVCMVGTSAPSDISGLNAETEMQFRFEDLCPDCDRIVEGYIRKIRMDSEEETPKRKSKKDKSESKSEEKPAEEAKAPEVEDAKIMELPGVVAGPPAEEAKASTENPHPF
jgi:hypothetical protein